MGLAGNTASEATRPHTVRITSETGLARHFFQKNAVISKKAGPLLTNVTATATKLVAMATKVIAIGTRPLAFSASSVITVGSN